MRGQVAAANRASAEKRMRSAEEVAHAPNEPLGGRCPSNLPIFSENRSSATVRTQLYCSVASAIQSVTARSAPSRPSLRPCACSNTASCVSADVPLPTMVRQCCTSLRQPSAQRVALDLLDHLSSISATEIAPWPEMSTNVPCTP